MVINLKHPSELRFDILSKIGVSRVPIYLICTKDQKQEYALKVYPFKDENPNRLFLLESRFTFLSHPNVIHFVATKKSQPFKYHGRSIQASYIIMEASKYGDFATIWNSSPLFQDEKLVRTFFHQLCDGLEYLHSQGVAHLDLKAENLLLGDDFKLKIIDFDSAYKEGDSQILSKGTKNYRAPEIQFEGCYDPYAADIYAAGIVLFVLSTGVFPCVEDYYIENADLCNMMLKDDPRFWEFHSKINREFTVDEDFKTLFSSMIRPNPQNRATLEEIKSSNWYIKPIYNENELKKRMSDLLKVSPKSSGHK